MSVTVSGPPSDTAPTPGSGAAAAVDDRPEQLEWPGPTDAHRFLNREQSWLEFNARVLAQAEDGTLPLLERVKFLAIFSQNLDEFFEVRVSGLIEQRDAGVRVTTPDGLGPAEQLRIIRARVDELVDRQTRVFLDEIVPALDQVGIRFADWSVLTVEERASIDELFAERVFPVLTPLAVDPAHPFPYISNRSLNLAVVVRDPASGDERFARVKVPPLLPRFLAVGDDERFVPLEQVIAAHLGQLFPGMEILSHHAFRVTRDTDFELEDEAEDLLEALESVLRRRSKFGKVVRLEVAIDISPDVLHLLSGELELPDHGVSLIRSPLDLAGLWSLYALDRPELKDEAWTPQTQAALAPTDGADLFRTLRNGDILVHHPYDSFTTSVEEFAAQAADDPDVVAIKQTIYRSAGPDSAVVQSLVRAAEKGKQVVALVELKARFDEQANIERARVLEEAGVHVVYGLVGLKTHAKVLLVVRQEADGIRRYCHVGTGNYNSGTAHLYEDLGLLSADPDLGADLTDLFNHLTGYSHQRDFRLLIVAPTHLRSAVRDRIRREAAKGRQGRITLKMNSLVDAALIDELYLASMAGTPIDLIVRGICCLRPGVPGLSETVQVRSIVGRFLEHSRIYRFGRPDDPEVEHFVGSADLMPRNLDRRVEALVPVQDPRLRARLDEVLAIDLADDVLAWGLHADGSWRRVDGETALSTHVKLQELAIARAHGI